LYVSLAYPRAQDVQFPPEVDAHLTLNSTFRTYLEAKDDRDGGESDQFAIGSSLQVYLKPLLRLKKVTAFDLDDAKSRFLVLEVGYRYLAAPNAPPDNRMIPVVTFNFPIKAGFHLAVSQQIDGRTNSFDLLLSHISQPSPIT
jgi:hypothetical protein